VRATTLAAGGLACAGAAMTIAAFAGGADGTATTAPSPGPARDGLAVWIEQGCGSCHTFAPAGSTAPIGPDLEVARVGMSREDVTRAIVAPPANGPMPEDFATRISPPDLERLVDFVVGAE